PRPSTGRGTPEHSRHRESVARGRRRRRRLMARERKARVHGPYKHRNRWRVIVVREGGERVVGSYATLEEAEQVVRDALRELAGDTTVIDAIDRFEGWLRSAGVKEVTVRTSRERLDRFFGDGCAWPLRRLSPKRC